MSTEIAKTVPIFHQPLLEFTYTMTKWRYLTHIIKLLCGRRGQDKKLHNLSPSNLHLFTHSNYVHKLVEYLYFISNAINLNTCIILLLNSFLDLNLNPGYSVPVTTTFIFIDTNIKPVDSQFTCSLNSQLDQAAVKNNLRKDFMQISTNR